MRCKVRCNGHKLGQTWGDGEGQGGLACCSPWGSKKSDVTGQLNNPTVHKTSKTAALDPGFKTVRCSVCSSSNTKQQGAAPVTLKVFSVFPEKISCLHHQLGGDLQCPQMIHHVPYLPAPCPYCNRPESLWFTI